MVSGPRPTATHPMDTGQRKTPCLHWTLAEIAIKIQFTNTNHSSAVAGPPLIKLSEFPIIILILLFLLLSLLFSHTLTHTHGG